MNKGLRFYVVGLSALVSTNLFAGDLSSPAPPSIPVSSEPDAFQWITPTLNIRARYEFRDQDGFDASHALTVRERLGLKFGEFAGFSAFIEGEFSQAAIDDFDTPQATTPQTPGNTVIADPETNELNQAYISYKGYDTEIKLGRQRIKIDGDQFVGNVGWRQNEQTYDALSIKTKPLDDLTLFYAYSDRVNRIFGSDATGALRRFEGDFHFFNVNYKGIDNLDLTGYAYLVDFDQGGGPASANGDTYGAIAKTKLGGVSLYSEVAYQVKDDGFDDAVYAHFKASKTFGDHSFTLGYEYLDQGFATPFATVHAYNGFADVFIGQRITGGGSGLSDAYLQHSTKLPGGIVWKNWFHIFGDNDSSFNYGWEYDSVLVKKINDNLKAVVKVYHFESESEAFRTTTGVTSGLNYTF